MGTRFNSMWQRSLLTLGVALAGACGSDDEAGPTGGPNLGIDGSVPSIDAGAGSGDGGTPGQTGCFTGKASTNEQLLNTCAEGCRPFDNVKRLPGYQPGKLPPLQ